MAFRNVFQQAKPSLLEPIVSLQVSVPEDHVGDVYSDMSGRRGRVLGSDSMGGGMQMVKAEAPLSEITTYARSLSSYDGRGQGSFTMEFSHYDVVPGNIQQSSPKPSWKRKDEGWPATAEHGLKTPTRCRIGRTKASWPLCHWLFRAK
ncbi:MAG: hypothetical protein R3C28_06395 [Pirellulaceae bacterium]